MPRTHCLATVGLLLLLAAPALAAVDVEVEKAAIARAVDASIGWFATKDFDLLFRTLADDEELYIVSPDSKGTVRGIQAFRAQTELWRKPGSRYLRHEVRDLRVHVHASGEVAWFSATLDDCGEYDGRQACWNDTRWTGVLEKRERGWVIVQMHFSFASEKVREQVERRLRAELAAEPGAGGPTR